MSAPIVFLHPLGADARFWDPVRAVMGTHSTVAFDQPGHGSAPPPPAGADIDAYSAPVAQQIAALGEPAHLVGMSLGGLVAQHLGTAHPDLVASLLLADTVPVYPDAFRETWRQRAEIARTDGLASLVEPMVEMWFTAGLAQRNDQRVEQARRTFAATDPEGYARTCEVLADVDLRESVAALTVPAAVVCGEDDAPAFRDAAQWLAETTGAAVRWLPGRHACAVESPERFAEIVTATTSTV
jgi:pimeloyl-ACP methyl ester carboxylesterase